MPRFTVFQRSHTTKGNVPRVPAWKKALSWFFRPFVCRLAERLFCPFCFMVFWAGFWIWFLSGFSLFLFHGVFGKIRVFRESPFFGFHGVSGFLAKILILGLNLKCPNLVLGILRYPWFWRCGSGFWRLPGLLWLKSGWADAGRFGFSAAQKRVLRNPKFGQK